MEKNEFLNDSPEQVILIPKPRIIRIVPTTAKRAYGLFDTRTGTQVSGFVKGNDDEIEFKDLNPNMHYDVGVVENIGDEKPHFSIAWNTEMLDDTDDILKNSDNLPIEYPYNYRIIYDDNSGIYDMVDKNDEPVGQIINLTQTSDKPIFVSVHSFKMKDDAIE